MYRGDGVYSPDGDAISQTVPAANALTNGFTAEKVEDLRKQLIAMYEGVGLPAEMVKDLPPGGIVEMAQLRGLIEIEAPKEA